MTNYRHVLPLLSEPVLYENILHLCFLASIYWLKQPKKLEVHAHVTYLNLYVETCIPEQELDIRINNIYKKG